VVACLKRDAKLRSRSEAELKDAAGKALERAYRVATVLRAGGWPEKCTEREALGYVAVSGEDDQPHRPVDIPSAEFTQYDLDVSVGGVTVHRATIAETGGGSPSCAYRGTTLPPRLRPGIARRRGDSVHPRHGLAAGRSDASHPCSTDSARSAEEPTVIALDMPTSGYADNLDYNRSRP
jgi:hypothetical protein